MRAQVTDRVRDRELFMPLNSVESPVNRLTSSHTDRATHTPAYKETAVRMKVLADRGEAPLPPGNLSVRPPHAATGGGG